MSMNFLINSSPVLFFTCLFLGLLLFFFLGSYISSLKNKSQQAVLGQEKDSLFQQLKQTKEQLNTVQLTLKKELEDIRRDKEELGELLAVQNQKELNYKEHIQRLTEDQSNLTDQLEERFELMASRILEDKSKRFTLQNKENIQQILTPLQLKIQQFEKKVEDTNKDAIDRNAALREQIIGLKELNSQMSKETINLTKALKGDSKTQGNWGELVLERVLEKSGLEKGREYEVEKSFDVEEEGKIRVRPDVIIHLPGDKKMIIDSKVTLTAYERFVNEEDETLKKTYLKQHLTALRSRIDELSAKKYEDLYQIESPDFVLLFIPIEPAFAVALAEDNQLYNRAFEKNIVIVTPTTLLATLRTIDSMWNNEKQQRNAVEIARQAGAMYDKFEGLVQDLIKIGKKMDDAKLDYGKAMNKLVEGKGNLISSVEKIKKLGAKAKKTLPNQLLKRSVEED